MAINATPGDVNADSYVTVAEAGVYHAAAFNHQAWATLDEPSQETLLKTATRYIDQFMSFTGVKASSSQALKFPRIGCYDDEDELIPSDVIPTNLKHATFELAWYLHSVGDLKFSTSNRDRIKVAVIDIHMKTTGNDLGLPDYIETLMAAFGESNFQGGGSIKSIRLVRV